MIRPPGTSERSDLPLAVIVGAGAMGSAIARRLGADHRLIIADRDEARVTDFAATLRTEGHDATGIACDITVRSDVEALAQQAQGWRTLAHVAALSPGMGSWRQIHAVNLLGTLHVEDAFFRAANPLSAAIFISSLAAHRPPPPEPVLELLDGGLLPDLLDRLDRLVPDGDSAAAYALSKHAMNRMCRRRAAAWGTKGARLLSLSPGIIDTPMGAAEFRKSSAKVALYELTPLGREGTMIEIAATLAFLASPAAAFVSGVDVLVDGGLAAAREFPALPA